MCILRIIVRHFLHFFNEHIYYDHNICFYVNILKIISCLDTELNPDNHGVFWDNPEIIFIVSQ